MAGRRGPKSGAQRAKTMYSKSSNQNKKFNDNSEKKKEYIDKKTRQKNNRIAAKKVGNKRARKRLRYGMDAK